MFDAIKRVVRASAAYQAGDLLGKLFALVTLPLYTHLLSADVYGTSEVLLTTIIAVSIVLRLGVGEAFIRFHAVDQDADRRARLAAMTVGGVALVTTVVCLLGVVFARPLSPILVHGPANPLLIDCALLGVWAFTNLEIINGLLRAEERAGTYMRASIVNVSLTVPLTIWLVVVARQQTRGILIGNFGASAVVLLGLWWSERATLLRGARLLAGGVSGLRAEAGAGFDRMRVLLGFGLPTVPADLSVYALQLVDRRYLYSVTGGGALAGTYSAALKLATVVYVVVRGFQYAWPTVAYSVHDDGEAALLYGRVTTWYVFCTGAVVAGAALFAHWVVLMLGSQYRSGASAIPWLALGWALYGLYLIFVVVSGRVKRTGRNVVPAVAGLAANVVALVALVPPLGVRGAAIALCVAYVVMIATMYVLTRRVFSVSFEWARIGRLLGVLLIVGVVSAIVLPAAGAAGFVERAVVWLAIVPALLACGFFSPGEIGRIRSLVARAGMRGT